MTKVILIALLLLGLVLATVGTAAAHLPCADVDGDGSPSGREYGLFHVSSHTPHGPPDVFHNPGSHMGFSACLGVH